MLLFGTRIARACFDLTANIFVFIKFGFQEENIAICRDMFQKQGARNLNFYLSTIVPRLF